MIGWLALACAILFNTAGNFLISLTTELQSPLSYLNPWFVLGIAFFGVKVFFYSRALKDISLLIAYPALIGISLSLVAIFAVFFLKERFGMAHAARISLLIPMETCLTPSEYARLIAR
jgi:multidrug transporter EmrE-like cation transporter